MGRGSDVSCARTMHPTVSRSTWDWDSPQRHLSASQLGKILSSAPKADVTLRLHFVRSDRLTNRHTTEACPNEQTVLAFRLPPQWILAILMEGPEVASPQRRSVGETSRELSPLTFPSPWTIGGGRPSWSLKRRCTMAGKVRWCFDAGDVCPVRGPNARLSLQDSPSS